MKSGNGEDRVLMSFTDVLTCVFGAAILMFLVFAILVVFEPLGPARAGIEDGPTDRELRSIQDNIIKGFATSTVRILSPSEVLLGVLRIDGWNPAQHPRRVVRVTANGRTYHGYQIEYQDVLGRLAIRLPEKPPPNWSSIGRTDLVVSVAVGGMVSCLKIPISRSAWAVQPRASLADIEPDTLGFLRSNFEGSSCVGV